MKTRSLLVYFPGCPFTIGTLMPNHRLASVAACLDEAGHATQVRDYGVPETLDRLYPGRLHATAQALAERLLSDPATGSLATLSSFWQFRTFETSLRDQQERLCGEVAVDLANERKLDFVAFDIAQAEDLKGILAIASRLRAAAPGMRLIALGAFAEVYGEALARTTDVFDCVCLGDAEWSVPQWAERLDRPDTWHLVPNLAYKRRGSVRTTCECSGLELDKLPKPAYDEDLYPALGNGGKMKLYSVETARRIACDNAPRTKSPRAVCDELQGLVSKHGVHAVRLTGAGTPPSHVDAVALEILARGLSVWYSRHAAIHDAKLKSFATLKASGCRAVSFTLDTGSQWLIDEYYGHAFGVTEAEHILRASKISGLFTVARLRYPCPADDYHTRAETLRIVERIRPHAALIEMPAIVEPPRGEQGLRARHFDIDTEDYLNYTATGRDRFTLPMLRRRTPGFRRPARTLADVLRERDVLTREIEGLGVNTALPEDIALAAQALGYEGHEHEFVSLMRQHLFTGDAASLSAAVRRFNQRVSALANTVALRTFEPVLAAVGN